MCNLNVVGIGFHDHDYHRAGAEVLETAEEVYHKATMIVKVKEPQPQRDGLLKAKHIPFTYLHLAPDMPQAEALIQSGVPPLRMRLSLMLMVDCHC